MPQAIAAAAAWVATAATAAAAAVGVSTTMGSALAIYSTVQAVATVAISVGAQVGLSALTSPKVGGAGMSGTQVDFQSNPDAGVPYLVGESGTAGVYVYNTVGEAKNRNLLFTAVHSLGPVEGYTGFKADGEEVTFGPLQQAMGGTYGNRMWQNRQLGLTPSPAFGPPNTLDPGVLAEWTAEHRLSGLAASWYVLGYDQKTYAAGAPPPVWKLKGVRAYDPRLDSTYPGGAGPQRAHDETTWAWSDNPWVHAITWCLGRRQNGKLVMGLGCAPAGVDMAAYVEGANVADANGWKVGGVVYSTDSKWEVLKAFCQAGGGRPIALGARISCLVNAPRVSIATLSGADIEGDPTITATQSRRGRVNAVVPRYRSEDHGFEIVAADPLVVAAYVAADGGEQRTQEIEYPLVQDVTQAAQLAAYAITNSREFGPNIFAVTPAKGWALKPGDCITVTEPEFGLNGQKLIVTDRERNLTTGGRILTCVSETDGKHDYCLGRVGTPPPTPGLTGVDPTPEAPASGVWTVTAGAVDEHGSPTLVLTGACDDPNARWINVEYRLTGETEWTAWPGGPPASTRFEITGLAPVATYDVAVSYTSVLNLVGERRILTATTTGALPTPDPAPADTTPPAAPTALAYEASLGTIFLSWSNPGDADVDKVEIWEAASNNRANATRIATAAVLPSGKASYARSGLDTGVTRYYWVRAADKTGNLSAFFPASATDGFAATTESLFIDDFAAGIKPVGRGFLLPDPSTYSGDLFFLTTNNKLYRKVGGTWDTGTPASDITGQITETQIGPGAVSTPKLAAGAVTTSRLSAGAVDAGIIAAGAVQTSHLSSSSVSTDKLAANAVVASKVAANTITADRLVVAQIDSYYIKPGAIANAGVADWSGHTLLGTGYTAVGTGISVECRGGAGSFTTIVMLAYIDAANEDMVNAVGLWTDLAVTGAAGSFMAGGASALVHPGNPANFCVPMFFRVSATGYINMQLVAFANLTGPYSQLYATRVKLVPLAVYNS